jgi:hypothetical protein
MKNWRHRLQNEINYLKRQEINIRSELKFSSNETKTSKLYYDEELARREIIYDDQSKQCKDSEKRMDELVEEKKELEERISKSVTIEKSLLDRMQEMKITLQFARIDWSQLKI